MKNIFASIISIIAFTGLALAFIMALNAGLQGQEKYAAAHNCRYESGYCYTYEQRGYLFPEQCNADADCRKQWGL